jgi:putative Mg2+ transporter-C (MgtC) family protein
MTTAYSELLIALVLGAIIGVERSFAHKTAGIRTYGLVSMGSCLLVIISNLTLPSLASFNALDPQHFASSIIVGIGFLCGGVIIFQDKHLSGLTTAAGLWVSSAVGIAVGYGFVSLAIFATLSTLVVLTVFWYFEHMITRRFKDTEHDGPHRSA